MLRRTCCEDIDTPRRSSAKPPPRQKSPSVAARPRRVCRRRWQSWRHHASSVIAAACYRWRYMLAAGLPSSTRCRKSAALCLGMSATPRDLSRAGYAGRRGSMVKTVRPQKRATTRNRATIRRTAQRSLSRQWHRRRGMLGSRHAEVVPPASHHRNAFKFQPRPASVAPSPPAVPPVSRRNVRRGSAAECPQGRYMYAHARTRSRA